MGHAMDDAKFDVIGNPILVEAGGSWSWQPNFAVAVGEIQFLTGRGRLFVAHGTFPPIVGN
jgi:hypothetical protein